MLTKASDIALVLALQHRVGEKRMAEMLATGKSKSPLKRLASSAAALNLEPRPAELRMAEKLATIDVFLLLRGIPGYPARLESALGDNAPLMLYCRGNRDLLNRPMIAIIGTRRPTLLGRDLARQYVREFIAHDWTIVSGNAPGIDSAAHEEALLRIGTTVIFPAVPIDAWKPEFHLSASAMERTLVCSPFVPGSETRPYCFLRRNSLVAAMCRSALVAETGTRGGTLDTVAKLKAFGRATFAIDFPTDARRYEAHRMLFGGGVTPLPHQVSRNAAEVVTAAAQEDAGASKRQEHQSSTSDLFSQHDESRS